MLFATATPAYGAPTAQERADAKRAYAQGRKLLAQGQLAEAVLELRRAHELAPTPVTRLELARALASLGKLVEAHQLAESTTEMPITPTETEKSKISRKDAAEFATSLAPQIPRVTITVHGGGAGEQQVTIDDRPLSQALLGSEFPLDPGRHVANVTEGTLAAKLEFELAVGERRNITLSLPKTEVPIAPSLLPIPKPAKVSLSPSLREPLKPQEPDGVHPVVPVMLSIGGVGIAVGAVTGAIAWSQASELVRGCQLGPSGNLCPPRLASDLATHQALTTVSTVGFIAGGAMAAAGAIAWIIDGSSSDSPVRVVWTGTSIALEGVWQ